MPLVAISGYQFAMLKADRVAFGLQDWRSTLRQTPSSSTKRATALAAVSGPSQQASRAGRYDIRLTYVTASFSRDRPTGNRSRRDTGGGATPSTPPGLQPSRAQAQATPERLRCWAFVVPEQTRTCCCYVEGGLCQAMLVSQSPGGMLRVVSCRLEFAPEYGAACGWRPPRVARPKRAPGRTIA
jgi:hypothetical protein